MNIYITAQTYNSVGWHPTVSLVAQYFMQDGVDFGSTLKEICITFYFSSDEEASSSLEELVATFRARRAQLPKVVFRRKNCSASIEVASEILKTAVWEGKQTLSASVFRAAALETIASLKLLASRIKLDDDLDFGALLAHFENAAENLPRTDDELASLAIKLLADKQRRIEKTNPWELLGIDFSTFHPDARGILDDPFYWNGYDDFAPHGNDTGADLLVEYRKWLKKKPAGNALDFYSSLLRKWGFADAQKDDVDTSFLDEAVVALVFAELKLRGSCSAALAELGHAALCRRRQDVMTTEGWERGGEEVKGLVLLEKKLSTIFTLKMP